MEIKTLLLALLFMASIAYAIGYFPGHPHLLSVGSAQITSPKDGVYIDGEARNMLAYDFHPSTRGNHLVIYVDDQEPVIVREWRGSYRLPLLGMGKHRICVKEANSSNVLTGLQKCLTVTSTK